MSIKLGSLFDGSGGFPLAGAISGIEPVWAAEVEPYPIAVTRSRFPQMEHLGSVTEVHGDKVRPVDVITFGSPCQDLSVAGKRAGIHDGQRSNLFFEAIRIIKEMRDATNGRHPTFAVWENVPGAFSSNKGADFRCVLEAFVRISAEISVPGPANGRWNPAGEIVGDGFSIAWRQLDAQYWGVPQRRKRIYLVADFRGGRAGEILFERESMRGNPAACRTPRQGTAADTTGSAGGSRGIECLNPWDAQSIRQYAVDGVFPTLAASSSGGQNRADVCFKIGQGAKARSLGESETVTPTLGSEAGGNSVPGIRYPQVARTLTAEADVSPCIDRGQNVVCYDARGNGDGTHCPTLTYALQGNGIDRAETAGCNGRGWRENLAYTLNTIDRHAVCYQDTVGALCAGAWRGPGSQYVDQNKLVVTPICTDARGNGDGTCCPTLTGDHENRVTDYTAITVHRSPKIGESAADGTASTMAARDFKSPRDLVVEHPPAYGVDCRNAVLDEQKTHTLQAKANGGQSLNCTPSVLTSGKPPRKYIVRRLTPMECCRLQGFPDGWGIPDHKDRLSNEELEFWQGVRDTCASIAGKPPKKYSAKSLTRWYNALHTDSAEYKMWGNGIALPCAAFVLGNVAKHFPA